MPTPVEKAVDLFIRAWSEPDAALRAQMIEACFAEDGVIVSPGRELRGRAALASTMDAFIADPQIAGLRILSAIDARGNLFRFRVATDRKDGTSSESFDAGQIDASGRISVILTFSGALPDA